MVENLQARSTRELQAYGAACLVAFSASFRLAHSSIRQLVEHLLRVLVAKDLVGWEAEGTALALSGRGDPLPSGVSKEVPASALGPFADLVEAVVEIGLVDIYGADTKGPLRFTARATDVLRANGVDVPSAEQLFGSAGGGSPGWGEPLPDQIYENARHWCLERLSKGGKA